MHSFEVHSNESACIKSGLGWNKSYSEYLIFPDEKLVGMIHHGRPVV